MFRTDRRRWKTHIWIFVCLTIVNIFLLVIMSLKELTILESREECPLAAEISTDPTENRRKIASYSVGDSEPYLEGLGLVQIETKVSYLNEAAVIVTATSSSYFFYAQGLVERLTKTTQPKLRIVVFDIGMTEDQRQKLCQMDECEVRTFPFHKFPSFLKENIQSMAWRPVLIQIALQEFGFVIWMDSIVYLIDGDLQSGIDIAKQHGISVGYRRLTYQNVNLAFETDKRTFRALGEQPCAFRHSFNFNTALIFIRKSPLTYKYIMRPWVSCALTESCIVADRKPNSKYFGANQYGYCHRFDQSVLSIILNRLFYSQLADIDLADKVRWTKCFKKDTVLFFNEMVILTEDGDNNKCTDVKWTKK